MLSITRDNLVHHGALIPDKDYVLLSKQDVDDLRGELVKLSDDMTRLAKYVNEIVEKVNAKSNATADGFKLLKSELDKQAAVIRRLEENQRYLQ